MLKTVGNPSTRYGDQTIVGGNLVIGTAGKGIDFSAASHSSGMTSELLDDYEEGNFTPFFTGDGGNPTITYSTQFGRYTKVGNLVFVNIGLVVNTVAGGSGQLRIAGLPFAADATGTSGLSNGFVYNFVNNVEDFNISGGLDSVTLYRSTALNTVATTADLQASTYCYISGCYRTPT